MKQTEDKTINADLAPLFDDFGDSLMMLLNESTGFQEVDSSEPKESEDLPFCMNEWIIIDEVTDQRRSPRLFEFLFLLLANLRYLHYASWIKKADGIFKIHRPDQVAELWNRVKTRKSCQSVSFEAMTRCIRFYYKCGLMTSTRKKYIYQFQPERLSTFQRISTVASRFM